MFRRTLLPLITATLLLSAAWATGCGSEAGDDAEANESSRPAGCFGKCDGTEGPYESSWEADLDALNNAFADPKAPIETFADAYSVIVDLGETKLKAPTHLFGVEPAVIPYGNEDGVQTADGQTVERRDSVIADFLPPGRVGIMVKNHRITHRYLDLTNSEANLKEHFKLQDTHVGLAVGVERDGKLGAISINNPQTYEDGLFGTPDYPMIFLEPTYPDYVPSARQVQFKDNILSWLMVFAAVSEFPGDYNGGDPLAAHSPETVLEHAKRGVEAIAGDADARAWFEDDAHRLYCSELAFLSHTAGIHVPMTEAFMSDLVGSETWEKFQAEVDKHNAGQPSAFSELNDNDKISYVRMKDVPEDLAPIFTYASDEMRDAESDKLALKPFTAADIIDQFLRTHLPREELGEQIAPAQGQLLAKMKPGLFEMLGMDRLPDGDPRRAELDAFYDQLVDVIAQPYGSYDEFRQTLAPFMEQARQITSSRPDGPSLFVPPSLFHSTALGKHDGGLLGMKYLGHGVHWSHVQAKSNDEPEPAEPDDTSTDEILANSCQLQCVAQAEGGCWCDEQCSEYGDCCDDYAQHCSESQ